MHAVEPARPPARTVVVLGMLSTFGPLSLDLYLPALPELADDLDASASAAQLSITACLVGLAVGQLVAGPLSDRLGRRRPLIVGLVGFLLASVACALAPSAAILVLLRFIQGLAGAAGLVISRAIARDLYSGRALMIFFSRLILVAGLAPVIAPILGGQLSRIMSWRGIFGVLAGFGAVLLLAGWLGLKETLPPERRIVGGFSKTLHGYNTLLHDRFFVGCALSSGLAGASMFAYISGSTFVLQRIYGMSPQGFSFVFGCNLPRAGDRRSGRGPPCARVAAHPGTRFRLGRQSVRSHVPACHGDHRATSGGADRSALGDGERCGPDLSRQQTRWRWPTIRTWREPHPPFRASASSSSGRWRHRSSASPVSKPRCRWA